jgi:hypothetical protein
VNNYFSIADKILWELKANIDPELIENSRFGPSSRHGSAVNSITPESKKHGHKSCQSIHSF